MMRNFRLKILSSVFFSFCFIGYSQNPRVILNKVNAKLNQVDNYKASILIKVDLPYITLLPIHTKLYFKQKDKFKIDTKRIAVLPKQGFMQFKALIEDTINYSAILQSTEMVNNVESFLINLISNNDTSDVILAKLWVDSKNSVIIKSQVTTKSSGTIKTEYTYGSQLKYGLPDGIKFMVDIKKFKVPKAIAADINTSKSEKVQGKLGIITVSLKDYEINKGIPNSFFDKAKS